MGYLCVGKLRGVGVAYFDKQTADQSAKTEDQLSDTDDFEKMIYLITHDLRNSVRALKELPVWIEDDLRDQDVSIKGDLRENLDLMNIHSIRLDQMLADLLIYSRVGKNQSVQSLDLEKTIAASFGDMDNAEGFDVTCALDCEHIQIGGIDGVTLIHSILSNAVKHHDSGSGTIHIESHKEGADCVMRITDDGPGIAQKDADRVFDLFTTLKSRDDMDGSGMGLATAKKIAMRYGGDVRWVDPNGSRGSTVEVRLPT